MFTVSANGIIEGVPTGLRTVSPYGFSVPADPISMGLARKAWLVADRATWADRHNRAIVTHLAEVSVASRLAEVRVVQPAVRPMPRLVDPYLPLGLNPFDQ